MNYCIEAIEKYIPPKNVGYRFIKRATVFIPFKEVGLSILERKQVNISFVFETILKLLSQGINDIDRMSLFLGLDIDIYKEIIAQMAVEDLITVSEMSIFLAPKGKQALQSLTKIVVAKSQINRIFTNLVTGEIETEDKNGLYDRPKPNNMCLNQCFKPDIQFYRDNFAVIENIYHKNKVDEVVFNNHTEKQDSLYRILDMVYEETKYFATYCFVYINDDDSSLLFSFENDKGSEYAATAISQVSDNVVGAMNLFRSDFIMPYKQTKLCHSAEKEQALKQLIGQLERRSKTVVATSEIETLYYKDRYLLDGEVRDLLINCTDYKPKNIVIWSAYMKDFLQDNDLINMFLSLNPTVTLSFFYNSKEYGVDKSVKWILNLAKEKDRKRLSFQALPDEKNIDYTIIICQPAFVIKVFYEEVKDNKQRPLLKETAEISFDAAKIDEAFKMLTCNSEGNNF